MTVVLNKRQKELDFYKINRYFIYNSNMIKGDLSAT